MLCLHPDLLCKFDFNVFTDTVWTLFVSYFGNGHQTVAMYDVYCQRLNRKLVQRLDV